MLWGPEWAEFCCWGCQDHPRPSSLLLSGSPTCRGCRQLHPTHHLATQRSQLAWLPQRLELKQWAVSGHLQCYMLHCQCPQCYPDITDTTQNRLQFANKPPTVNAIIRWADVKEATPLPFGIQWWTKQQRLGSALWSSFSVLLLWLGDRKGLQLRLVPLTLIPGCSRAE